MQEEQKELSRLLSEYPDKEKAIREALKFIGHGAGDWYDGLTIKDPMRLVDEKTGFVKRLFETKKHKYTIRMPEDGIGLKRFGVLKKAMSVVGNDATFPDQLAALADLKKCVLRMIEGDQEARWDMLQQVVNMDAGIKKTVRNFDYSVQACTTFIIREDEDLTDYDNDIAAEKVEDWEEFGIHEQDFFFLALLWVGKLSNERTKLSTKSRIAVMAKR
jgi:hypothetical protein